MYSVLMSNWVGTQGLMMKKKIFYGALYVSILYFLLWCPAVVQDTTRRYQIEF